MNRPIYSVLIVGGGKIAGGFDAQRSEDAPPLGHVKAYQQHGGFEVRAVIDPDQVTREAFRQRWRIPAAYSSFSAMKGFAGNFDVISICSPTQSHAADLQCALALRPRIIFCEKPLTESISASRRLVEDCREANVMLAVAHLRRWAPDILRLRDQLEHGKWGKLRIVQAIYNKGVLNNGSHLIDLLQFLLGGLKIVSVGQPVLDYLPEDPSVPATLETTDGVPIQLGVAHAADYSIFELQLITERGVITMENGGLRWRIRRVSSSQHFDGYRVLDAGDTVPGEIDLAFRHAVANVYEAMTQGGSLACTGDTALEAQLICTSLQTQALRQPSISVNTSSVTLQ